MKILLILFGCLAVANAGIYYNNYAYHFSSSCYYPPTRCYRYTFSTCRSWFTTKYYSSILKVYPDSTCTERTIGELTGECETKLSDRRTEILGDLNKNFEDWKTKVQDIIDGYKTDAENYITSCYAARIKCAEDAGDTTRAGELIAERDQKIADYKQKLDDNFKEAKDNYQKSIDATMEKIKTYHDQLIANFETCLNNRDTKLNDFYTELDKRIGEYEQKYRDSLTKCADRQREAFKAVLMKINGDEAKADAVAALYIPITDIDAKVGEYRMKLDEYANKLKEYYKCALKCYAATGCFSFYKRSYYSYCHKIGNWWTYKVTFTVPCTRYVKYTYKWRNCEYKGLKDCDPFAENKTKDQVLEAMRTINTKAIDDAKAACITFFADLETKHAKCVEQYRKIIQERHQCVIDYMTQCLKAQREGGVLTPEDEAKIEAKRQELVTRENDCVSSYETQLNEKRGKAQESTKANIQCYAGRLEEFIVKIADRYQACLDAISARITSYTTKLTDMIAQRRTCLETNLNKVLEKNIACAQGLIKQWLGEGKMADGAVTGFIGCYRTVLEGERNTCLGDFDTFWAEWKPKLIADYGCRQKCTAPTYCARVWVQPRCFSWKISYPTFKCYNYFYKVYYTRYYHKYIGGHYYC